MLKFTFLRWTENFFLPSNCNETIIFLCFIEQCTKATENLFEICFFYIKICVAEKISDWKKKLTINEYFVIDLKLFDNASIIESDKSNNFQKNLNQESQSIYRWMHSLSKKNKGYGSFYNTLSENCLILGDFLWKLSQICDQIVVEKEFDRENT